MRVLLLSTHGMDLEFFKGAASLINLPIQFVSTPEQLCMEILRDHTVIVIVDVSSPDQFQRFEETLANKIGLFNQVLNPNRFFFISTHEDFDEVPYLAQSEVIGHFVPRKYDHTHQMRFSRLLKMAMAEGIPEGAFQMQSFFNKEVQIQSIKLTKSLQKKAIIDALRNQLTKVGFKPRCATLIGTAADEILMNGMFDAPIDATGKYIYAQTPRNTPLDFSDRDVVEFRIGFDGEMLAVSVLDQYGSLDKRKMLTHLSRSYKKEEFRVKTNIAGAGLGIATIYQNCAGMVFECEMGIRTQVTLFYKKTPSFKDFKRQFRFLSTFMYFS